MNTLFFVLFALIMVPAVVVLLGVTRWQSVTVALVERLEGARRAVAPRTFERGELLPLPAPVQAYFRAVLSPGQPLVAAAEIAQEGALDLGRAQSRWVQFHGRQRVFVSRPGWLWDARVRWWPGLRLFAHQGLFSGVVVARYKLFGLIPVVRSREEAAGAASELTRFLAEAVWYPTRLLPSQGVHWEEIDDQHARATISDDGVSVGVVFVFDDAGLVRSVRAQARERRVGGTRIETPWEMRFWEYRERGGMMIPAQYEMAWVLPQGRQVYAQGRVNEALYKFTP
ncbi:DUF6544 family protein [Marichromatium bheemlicum]|uniref:Uncharacterized protein n=1 Tax=Marichromatium bheemlicum TaxID=365339 RepID=A0ABX1IDG1_9GAMM|nr:DUF6544 family protein [Marichromatium bheemlicum]NKN34116.1 hypothetical protein [Marichromatium bheemlicum]